MPEPLAAMQRRFAAHLRDPASNAAPEGIEDRRLAIYRGLFFNNISGFLARSFPVLRRVLGDEAWAALARAFYAGHRSHTPLFPELPREFVQFLAARGFQAGELPFLHELAHYEWMETALDLDPRELRDFTPPPGGDLLDGRPVLSPLAWPLSYAFPVHEIRPGFEPQEPPGRPTHLLVYRDRGDTVRFMKLNDVSLRLLQLLGEDHRMTGRQVLEQVARELQHPDPVRVVAAGTGLLADFLARDVVLGARPA